MLICASYEAAGHPSASHGGWGFHAAAALILGLGAIVTGLVFMRGQARLLRQAHAQFAESCHSEADRIGLASAINQASDAIVIIDTAGTIQYVNPAFTVLTGYTAEEAIGRNPRFLKSGRQDKVFYRDLWNTILAGGSWEGDVVNRRKDGSLYVEEMKITPVRDSLGTICRFIAIKHDATARRTTEEAQSLLASIVESSDDAIFSTALDGRIISWNRGAEVLYGYTAAEILGKPLGILVSPEEHDALQRNRQTLMGGGSLRYFDGAALRKDGKRIEATVPAYAIRDAGERIVAHAAIVRDISQSKEAERVRGLLASIVESSSDGILSNTLDGTILSWNKGAEAIWGYPTSEVIGKRLSILAPPDGHKEQAQVLERIRRGENCQLESVTVKADGSHLDIAITVSPIRNSAGEVTGCSTIARDISGQKRAEEALRQSEEKYRSLVANIPDVVWTADVKGDPVYVSSSCERVFGYTAEEICRPGAFYRLIHPEDLPRFEVAVREMHEACERGSQGSQTFGLEYRLRRKDGQWIWVLTKATGAYQREGEIYVDGVASDITERKLLEQQLADQVAHDPLTGLPNRQVFEESFERALELARRREEKLALLYLDVDSFKLVNDTVGHLAGDKLLKQVAQRLSGCLRESEMLAHVGGDEFMLVLAGLDESEIAPRIAERMLGSLSAPFHAEGHEVFLSASIGIASYPEDGQDLLSLQRCADAAMLTAKRQGRNRFQVFTLAMGVAASRRLEIETELHHALERREFSLYYQPKIELATGSIAGVEALLRWENPKLGTVAPSEFIPIAEETGLIVPISRWVVQEACRQERAWREAGCEPVQIAVNVSAVQLAGGNLPGMIGRALADNGTHAGCLDLEVTESAIMHDVNDSVRQLAELKQLGVSISLDDFGTGYSSLSYLVRFPIDHLKIDQGFIRRMDGAESSMILVHGIIALAHGLGMKTVAEGVESERDLESLKEMGCDLAQGFLLAKPMPPEYIGQMLSVHPRPVPYGAAARPGRSTRANGLGFPEPHIKPLVN
jgi:diguanylate cyclase (GGDEF)-like protein/PAS domain S-box-containing protein